MLTPERKAEIEATSQKLTLKALTYGADKIQRRNEMLIELLAEIERLEKNIEKLRSERNLQAQWCYDYKVRLEQKEVEIARLRAENEILLRGINPLPPDDPAVQTVTTTMLHKYKEK